MGGSAGVSSLDEALEAGRVGDEAVCGSVAVLLISSRTVLSFWKSSLSGTRKFPWWSAAAGCSSGNTMKLGIRMACPRTLVIPTFLSNNVCVAKFPNVHTNLGLMSSIC